MLFATAAVYATGSMVPLALAPLASFGFLLLRRQRSRPRSTRRYAHQLTLLRLLLLCYASWQLIDTPRLWLLAIFSANVLLDVADGYIARRFNQATHFGMVFDREVDGFYVLVACLYFNLVAGVAVWILVPGLLPYAYRLTAWTLGNPPIAERRQPLAAFLAGVNFVLLLIAVGITDSYRLPVLVISASIVTLSFLVSFRDLLRRRHERAFLQSGSD